jgi:hypothetical protein
VSKLKLGTILDDRPVKLAIELPAQVNRDLIAYAEVLGRETGQTIEPAKLVGPMLARFMSTDRAFARSRRAKREPDRRIRASSHPQRRPRHTKLLAACMALRRRRHGPPRQTSEKVAAKLVAPVSCRQSKPSREHADRYKGTGII